MPDMRRPPCFALHVVLPLVLLAPRAAAPAADEPPRLKTQVVRIKLHPENVRWDWTARPEVPFELVQLPPGKITLRGPDGKDREHPIKPIWVARFETRWDEYDVFWQGIDVTDAERRRGEFGDPRSEWSRSRTVKPYMPPDGGFGRWGLPASNIQFAAAVKYCAWLSKHTGRKFRLPTEAEWEYACRAGGPPVAPSAADLDAVAWFAGNSADGKDVWGDPYLTPHPVGRKRPNPWGLYDMLGNVGEYVIRDPKDDKGLLAGGSYKDQAKDVHSGAREPYSPDWQKNDPEDPKRADWLDYGSVHHVGFRVVMDE
jgi:formylglycine-generating enzyme required for sulfatase activity